MIYFVLIILISGTCGCEMDRSNSDTVLYFAGEILNLTLREGAYPDDVEVSKVTGFCSSPMRLLPDQYFDDTFKKYEHLKQIIVPMTSAMHNCAYDVTMRARSACLARRLVRFELRAPRAAAPPLSQCPLAATLRWRDELRAKLAAERSFVCDPEHALCEERYYVVRRDIVLISEEIIENLDSDYLREIQIHLREEDFAQNVSSFVCQAASQRLPGNFTVVGRLVSAAPAPAAPAAVQFRAGDQYNASCEAPHGHWLSVTHARTSIGNKTFTKKLGKEDDGMRLICVDINCEAFVSNQTCYKKILKDIRFRLKAAPGTGVIVGAVVACLVLAGAAAAACAVRARRARAPRDIARRARMTTPPPERPPHCQPYYSVPFERPIPGPHRD